jgi:hypothetical protein
MPRKRKFEKVRLDQMDISMESHLRSGSYLFPGGARFEDDGHRRKLWFRHRAEIMAQERPGCRPTAFWAYERSWPEGSETEEDAVHRMEDTTDRERGQIEENWLHSLRVALQWFTKAEAEAAARGKAAGFHGVPSWFFDRHAPRIRAELEAERRAWEARRGKVIQLGTRD